MIGRFLASGRIGGGWARQWLDPVIAVVIAFALGALVLVAIGKSPGAAYGALWNGAAGTRTSVAVSLATATPLLLAALAVGLSFRSGFFNIGVGGQLGAGAIAAAAIGAYVHAPGPLVIVLMIVGSGFAGMLWGGVPGVLRAYTGASEIVTTLMLNYVVLLLIDYLVTGPMRAPGAMNQSKSIATGAEFPVLVQNTQLTFAFVLGVVLVPVVWFVLWRTSYGFELRMIGLNQDAARAAGMSTRRIAASSLAFSGFLAGIGGAVLIGGVFWSLQQNFSIAVGFDAITVSLLGANNPWGILVASVFFGGITNGSALMEATVGVSGPFVQFLEAIVIASLVAVPLLLARVLRVRALTRRDRPEHEDKVAPRGSAAVQGEAPPWS